MLLLKIFITSLNFSVFVENPDRIFEPNRLWITNITHTSSQVSWEVVGVVGDDIFFLLGYQKADGSGENEVIRIEGTQIEIVTLKQIRLLD